MKIIHCSDMHLESKMESNLDSKKAQERRHEILITYQRMIKYAVENNVQIILIAGDMFDKRNVSAKVKNIVINSIKSNPQIDFIYLKGNHDEINFISDLEIIPSNLKLFSSDEWITYRYGNITISGIEFGEHLGERKINNTLLLNKNDINLVVLHGQVSETTPTYKNELINIKSLKNKNIDYLALGHIHKFEQERLDERGIYCYPGCLEGRGFDECGEKGFVLLDINETDKKIETEFVPFASRHLYEIEVDVSGTMTTPEVEDKIDEYLKDIEKEALVKIVLVGETEINSERDISYLEKRYGSIYYFVKVYDKTTLKIDYKNYENDASLKGEFIRLVLGEDLPQDIKQKIIITGIKAIRGEEVE